MTKFTKPVCSTCGSDDVKVDAFASWDTASQSFELVTTFDKGSVCEKCGGETSLEDIKLDGDELIEARAHYLALNDGWLPSDEDSAVQYCEDIDLTKPIEGEEP